MFAITFELADPARLAGYWFPGRFGHPPGSIRRDIGFEDVCEAGKVGRRHLINLLL
jgi:hypothetical protein